MEKSIVLYLVVMLIGYIKNSEAAEDSDLFMRPIQNSWNLDTLSPDDIRCYCNLAKCVITGYMCRTARSQTGGCFSEVRDSNDKSVARHGCMELLQDDDQRMQCDNSPRKHVKQSSSNFDSLLLCCHDDMCNHVDRAENKKLKPNLTSENIDDDKLHTSGSQYNDKQLEKHQQYPHQFNAEIPLSSSDYNSDVWFKAATIAVPICGAVILFILIALAIRILKNEGIDSPKLGGSGGSNRKPPVDYEAYGAHEHNIKESPLLRHSIYGNGTTICHNDLKNENLAKKNQLMSLEYSLLPQRCHDPNNKPTNTEVGSASLYRNINLSLNPSSKSGDSNDKKIYEKEVLNPASYWAGGNSNYGV